MESDSVGDCTSESGGSGHQLLTTGGTPATLTRTIADNATDEVSFAFTAAAANLTDWGSGTYTVELNVTAEGSNVAGYKAELVRVSSACAVLGELGLSASQNGT